LLEFLRLVVVRLVVSKKSKNHVSLHFRQVGFTVPESFMRPWSVMNLIARITEISENQTIPRIFHLQISLQPAIVLHPFCQAIPYQSNPVPVSNLKEPPPPPPEQPLTRTSNAINESGKYSNTDGNLFIAFNLEASFINASQRHNCRDQTVRN